MAPVSQLAASARSISIGNLSRRLPIVDTGDEIQYVAETCNEPIERLESTANEVSRFTADASHELRSPISYIYTLSESALRNPNLDEESSYAFKEIVRECSEATRLLDDILTLARFDAGHADTAFARLNLAEVLVDSCDKARPFVEIKHQQMKIRITESAPIWVLGDLAGLRRLFWILLDNAIKYTPASGGIDVTLATVGKDAVVSVADTGIGIPEADLPAYFDVSIASTGLAALPKMQVLGCRSRNGSPTSIAESSPYPAPKTWERQSKSHFGIQLDS
ncbi:HAMP domain-containing histidine kinase [Edaphobacter sp. HDX4]